jgi:hypothetical protein
MSFRDYLRAANQRLPPYMSDRRTPRHDFISEAAQDPFMPEHPASATDIITHIEYSVLWGWDDWLRLAARRTFASYQRWRAKHGG